MGAFKAIVFDYDGTLFDSRPAIIHCIKRTFEISSRPVPPLEAILQTVQSGGALQDTFLILDEQLRDDRCALHERVRTYRTIYLDEGQALVKPFAGTCPVIRHIHDAGLRCFIVSNKGIVAVHRSLEDSGLGPFVDLILADEPGLPRKPDPALLTDHVLPRYPQMRSHQILMVGDTETDILFAKASGMRCCWASYGYGDSERCRALVPDHEISEIGQLPAVIQSERDARD